MKFSKLSEAASQVDIAQTDVSEPTTSSAKQSQKVSAKPADSSVDAPSNNVTDTQKKLIELAAWIAQYFGVNQKDFTAAAYAFLGQEGRQKGIGWLKVAAPGESMQGKLGGRLVQVTVLEDGTPTTSLDQVLYAMGLDAWTMQKLVNMFHLGNYSKKQIPINNAWSNLITKAIAPNAAPKQPKPEQVQQPKPEQTVQPEPKQEKATEVVQPKLKTRKPSQSTIIPDDEIDIDSRSGEIKEPTKKKSAKKAPKKSAKKAPKKSAKKAPKKAAKKAPKETPQEQPIATKPSKKSKSPKKSTKKAQKGKPAPKKRKNKPSRKARKLTGKKVQPQVEDIQDYSSLHNKVEMINNGYEFEVDNDFLDNNGHSYRVMYEKISNRAPSPTPRKRNKFFIMDDGELLG